MKIKFNYLLLSLLTFAILYACSSDDDSGSETPISSSKQITGFVFNAANNEALDENITATVNENDKTITTVVPSGTDVSSLLPAIEASNGATVSPESVQDFSSEVIYTVTAEDGTKAQYIVTVNIAPNTEAKILSFIFLAENNIALEKDVTAIIDEDTKNITAEVPYGTDITGLTPTLEVSPDATFTPEGAQDFSSGVVYTVTAQDESTTAYIITIEVAAPSQREVLIAIYNANPGNTLEWDLDDPDINNWQGVVTDENNNIIELYLQYKKLSIIPAEVGQLPNLTQFNLYNNLLTSIPSEIGQLSKLQKLLVDNNELTSVPSEIGQLTNLEYIDLGFNQITIIPAEIGQLSKLEELFLDNNQLTSIPKEICDLHTNYGTNITTDPGVTCE